MKKALMLSSALSCAMAVSAATVNYWQSMNTDGLWNDAARWSLKTVPAAGDTFQLTGTATGLPQADVRSPKHWTPAIRGQSLVYLYRRAGFALIFK